MTLLRLSFIGMALQRSCQAVGVALAGYRPGPRSPQTILRILQLNEMNLYFEMDDRQ